MSKLNPDCPICRGVGWYEAPYHSDFTPRIEIQPCPDCHELSAPSKAELAALVIAFVVLALFLFASYGVAR